MRREERRLEKRLKLEAEKEIEMEKFNSLLNNLKESKETDIIEKKPL